MLTPKPSNIVTPVKASDDDHAAEVTALLQLVTISEDNNPSADPVTWKRCLALAWELKRYKPAGSCKVCRLGVIDALRTYIGLGPARRPADASLRDRRLLVCSSCPARVDATNSCGTLILGAFKHEAMEIQGRLVVPCGCSLVLKSLFKSESCPGNFWPNR